MFRIPKITPKSRLHRWLGWVVITVEVGAFTVGFGAAKLGNSARVFGLLGMQPRPAIDELLIGVTFLIVGILILGWGWLLWRKMEREPADEPSDGAE